MKRKMLWTSVVMLLAVWLVSVGWGTKTVKAEKEKENVKTPIAGTVYGCDPAGNYEFNKAQPEFPIFF